jgi:hypothetical protein
MVYTLVYSNSGDAKWLILQNYLSVKGAGSKPPNGKIPENMGRNICGFFRRSGFFSAQRTIEGQAP